MYKRQAYNGIEGLQKAVRAYFQLPVPASHRVKVTVQKDDDGNTVNVELSSVGEPLSLSTVSVVTENGCYFAFSGHRKGRDLSENLKCNFGMPGPEGYRKAQRLFRQAEKFGRPVITFVDTPGAYPGLEAEARGQAEAIARTLALSSRLTVPVVSVVTGEGGSGGDRKSTRLNSSHLKLSRMPSSA